MSGPMTLSVDVRVRRGEFSLDAVFESRADVTALFGPSGAGKTTLLHLVSGILKPDAGRIAVQGRVLLDTKAGIYLPPEKRRVGLVFQDAQLFPHLTVGQNIAFGTWFAPKAAHGPDKSLVIRTLGIEALLDRRPSQLSGGEKQRVALARAILSNPQLLLLDEPLASLDDERRQEILSLIERIRDDLAIPMLYVTHRADEVQRLASCVITVEHGRVTGQAHPAGFVPIASDRSKTR